MYCKNEFCIYQKKGSCLLTEVTLDINGMCEDCLYVDFDPAALERSKKKLREELERREKEFGQK